jgi:hypothetical protein
MARQPEVPTRTAQEFLELHSEDYSTKQLRKMLELADEAWFKAKEKELADNQEFKLKDSYEDGDFIPREYQGLLTQAISDEIGVGTLESASLARDLTRRYESTDDYLMTELEDSEFTI